MKKITLTSLKGFGFFLLLLFYFLFLFFCQIYWQTGPRIENGKDCLSILYSKFTTEWSYSYKISEALAAIKENMPVMDVHWNMNKEKERFSPNSWSRAGLGLDHLFQAFSVLFYLLLGRMYIFRERQSLPRCLELPTQ